MPAYLNRLSAIVKTCSISCLKHEQVSNESLNILSHVQWGFLRIRYINEFMHTCANKYLQKFRSGTGILVQLFAVSETVEKNYYEKH